MHALLSLHAPSQQQQQQQQQTMQNNPPRLTPTLRAPAS
jgi:hypothetical protein